jgi:hypothetical protein
MTTIQIQEFSTGIRYQADPDGTWVSLGFTGQYINVTDPNIPEEIIRAIANKDFSVAERGRDPAIIGREIVGANGGSWSVIAIVSQGKDEKGRSASFYRFLWCEGLNLASIIEWINNYQRKYHRQPVFNPVEQTGTIDYQISRHEHSRSSIDVATLPDPLPILLKPEDQHHNLSEIHALAVAKANGQQISWAVNAEALEKPWNFMVIKAASDRAYQIFQKSIDNKPREIAPAAFDEQALKSAIKSLMGSSIVKPEAIRTFMEALGTTQISDTYWNSLFDGQGAQNALDQNIYSPQMVRLLTLKLIAIPDFLEEYLKWIEIEDIFSRKGANDRIVASLEFQSKIKSEVENSQNTIEQLRLIFKKFSTKDDSSRTFEKVGDYLQSNNSNSSLARFYHQVTAYNIQRDIPKSLWIKSFPDSRSNSAVVFGETVYKQHRSLEVSKSSAIIFAILSFIIGIFFGVGGLLLSQNFSEKGDTPDKSGNQKILDSLEPMPSQSPQTIPAQNTPKPSPVVKPSQPTPPLPKNPAAGGEGSR